MHQLMKESGVIVLAGIKCLDLWNIYDIFLRLVICLFANVCNWWALWHHQDNVLADFNGVIWHFRRGKQMLRYVLALFDIPDLVIAKYWPNFFHWLFAIFIRFCFWPFPEYNRERLFALSNHCTHFLCLPVCQKQVPAIP